VGATRRVYPCSRLSSADDAARGPPAFSRFARLDVLHPTVPAFGALPSRGEQKALHPLQRGFLCFRFCLKLPTGGLFQNAPRCCPLRLRASARERGRLNGNPERTDRCGPLGSGSRRRRAALRRRRGVHHGRCRRTRDRGASAGGGELPERDQHRPHGAQARGRRHAGLEGRRRGEGRGELRHRHQREQGEVPEPHERGPPGRGGPSAVDPGHAERDAGGVDARMLAWSNGMRQAKANGAFD
jgi:hypothetical protein